MRAALSLALVCAVLILAPAALAEDLPTVDDLEPGWNELVPGGEAICALGDPYSFYVLPGASDQLVIYFQGGGACWNGDTCSEDGPYSKTVSGRERRHAGGIFDLDNPENPLADSSMVIVSYCSGDVHTGAATNTYTGPDGEPLIIRHNGFVNSALTLDWVYANYPAPEQVVITGSSAGAYGAIFHAPHIIDHYGADSARFIVLGDAGVGVTPAAWEGLDAWGTLDLLPENQAFAQISPEQFADDLYAAAAAAYPDEIIAEYTAYADFVQVQFYAMMGGLFIDWITEANARLAALAGELPNFTAYVGWGTSHTIMATELFYSMEVRGVRFRDWFAALVNGDVSEPVFCEDCFAPPQ